MTAITVSPDPHSRWLPLARAAWVVIVALVVGLTLFDIPFQIAHDQTVCSGPACDPNQFSPADVAQLQQAGLSPNFYAVALSVASTTFVLLFAGVGAFIMWRRSDESFAVFTAISLTLAGFCLTFGAVPPPPPAMVERFPALFGPVAVLDVAGNVSLYSFFYLFPDGRFIPRWTRWLVPVLLVMETIVAFRPGGLGDAYGAYVFLVFLTLICAGVYRYTRVSSLVQRQQTKYVVFGTSLAFIGVLGAIAGSSVKNAGNPAAGLPALISTIALQLCFAIIPLSIAMAILRSRLWDIDLLIRRTLVYAALTALLALVYFGSVVALQSLFTALTGEGRSELVTVISTLVIAALFVPVRGRLQALIDRRFYRRKYDAAQTLAGFSATLRDEVNLDDLTAHLLAAVDETMQPESVGLWLVKDKP